MTSRRATSPEEIEAAFGSNSPKDPPDVDPFWENDEEPKPKPIMTLPISPADKKASVPPTEAEIKQKRDIAEATFGPMTPPDFDAADFDEWRAGGPDAPTSKFRAIADGPPGTEEEWTAYLAEKYPKKLPGWAEYFGKIAAASHAEWTAPDDEEPPDIDPEDVPSELASLLDDLTDYYDRFVSFKSPLQAKATALWAMYTHCFPLDQTFDVVPYLMVTSAEPISGKSTVIDISEAIVHDPLQSADTSAANIGRNCGGKTLLLDEVDGIYGGPNKRDGDSSAKADEMKTILNNGYKRNGTYDRLVPGGKGKDYESKSWSVYGPKMLAGIGRTVPDTVQSRSVRIRLERKAHGDTRETPRQSTFSGPGKALKSRMAAMAAALGPLHIVPDLPEALGYRDMDIWEPLIALAERAGDEWSKTARDASIELTHKEPVMSIGVQLLHDIRLVFESMPDHPEHLPTMELIGQPHQRREYPYDATGLCAIETSIWAIYSQGRPISPTMLARLLSEYDIKPGRKHIDKDSYGPQGYFRAAFALAWSRYLDARPEDDPDTMSEKE